jgi:DNA repair exonuclease SbcCD ATPase subunit
VDDHAAKLARVESAAQSAAAAAAVAAAASPDEELAEIRALVQGLAGRVAATEQGVTSLAAPDDGIQEIRAFVERVVGRVAANEQTLAALASDAGSLRPALEELETRVETAERVALVPAAGTAGDGAENGDGRFRLELRALELRMEHAEAAARENREAVLTQLERLASRVEWRLQRLEETAQAESVAASAEAGADVVPIRGGADTT